MKIISFFSRFTFICNIAFLLFIFFSKIEAKKAVSGVAKILLYHSFFKRPGYYSWIFCYNNQSYYVPCLFDHRC